MPDGYLFLGYLSQRPRRAPRVVLRDSHSPSPSRFLMFSSGPWLEAVDVRIRCYTDTATGHLIDRGTRPNQNPNLVSLVNKSGPYLHDQGYIIKPDPKL